jgi:hypothetical protein
MIRARYVGVLLCWAVWLGCDGVDEIEREPIPEQVVGLRVFLEPAPEPHAFSFTETTAHVDTVSLRGMRGICPGIEGLQGEAEGERGAADGPPLEPECRADGQLAFGGPFEFDLFDGVSSPPMENLALAPVHYEWIEFHFAAADEVTPPTSPRAPMPVRARGVYTDPRDEVDFLLEIQVTEPAVRVQPEQRFNIPPEGGVVVVVRFSEALWVRGTEGFMPACLDDPDAPFDDDGVLHLRGDSGTICDSVQQVFAQNFRQAVTGGDVEVRLPDELNFD